MLMSINHNNVLSEFPFYNLDNQEFLRITGWVHHSYHTLTESKDLFQDTFARKLIGIIVNAVKEIVDNIYRLEVLKFSHSWHNGLLPEVFDNTFQYARNIHGLTPGTQLNRIFINIKLKLMQGSNHFLTWQLIFGKTFHLL